jgi:hypothetical protein
MAGMEVSEVTEAVTGEVTKVRKGKNFSMEEDKQLCWSFLSSSSMSICGILENGYFVEVHYQ